jgi:serine/threonine protein kinase
VHGDMTSNNVLVRRDAGGIAVRIIDFGMSSVAAGGRGVGGTTAFMAPELLAVPDDDEDGYVRCLVCVVACRVCVL